MWRRRNRPENSRCSSGVKKTFARTNRGKGNEGRKYDRDSIGSNEGHRHDRGSIDSNERHRHDYGKNQNRQSKNIVLNCKERVY